MRLFKWLLGQPLAKTINDCTIALSVNAQDADAYYRRALAYHQIGQFDEALADLDKTIELASANAWAYLLRANSRAAKAGLLPAGLLPAGNLRQKVREIRGHILSRNLGDVMAGKVTMKDAIEGTEHGLLAELISADLDKADELAPYGLSAP